MTEGGAFLLVLFVVVGFVGALMRVRPSARRTFLWLVRKRADAEPRKGGLSEAQRTESSGAGPGDLSDAAFQLEDSYASILELLDEHGPLKVGELMDLMMDTAGAKHVIVYTSSQAQVAAPHVPPVDYVIGLLAQHGLTCIDGPLQHLTPAGREALAEWRRLTQEEVDGA